MIITLVIDMVLQVYSIHAIRNVHLRQEVEEGADRETKTDEKEARTSRW